MYVCVLIRVYLYVCMHVYIYMCIYMCSIYMFMRRVCIHTRIPSFNELRFYVVYNIENRPFLGRGFNHAYIWMFYCVLYVIWNTYCFNEFYWIYGIRIVLLVFTWYVEYVLSACIFVSCFTYLCLVRNDLINMFKHNRHDGVSNHQPHVCLLHRLFTGDRWIPRINGQWRGKYFHLMTSSWHQNKSQLHDVMETLTLLLIRGWMCASKLYVNLKSNYCFDTETL